jgi:hypothetical protein
MRFALATLAVFAVAAGSAAGAGAPTLVGKVVLLAMEPHCGKAGCDAAARKLELRFRAPHRALRVVRTDAKGAFRIALPPGTYTVSTALTEDSPEAKLTPARVVVRRGAVVRQTFTYRTGR